MSIELEIKTLLDELGDPKLVTPRLIEFLEHDPEDNPITPENILAVAKFLLFSKQHAELIRFVLERLEEENFPIPWAYFLESIAQQYGRISPELAENLIEGIRETQGDDFAALSPALDEYMPEFKQFRLEKKHKAEKNFQRLKQHLLDELYTLRTQQLFEQEKVVLAKLQKMDPDDSIIKKELEQQKQRFAMDVLNKYKPSLRNKTFLADEKTDSELQRWSQSMALSFVRLSIEQSTLSYDCAVACFMLEEYESCLLILQSTATSPGRDWLYLEVLLRCRRFAELLSEIAQVELQYANEPETFFATAYLRAQALWGLGQKHGALAVLESLLASRPHYRAGSTLLSIWRNM